MGFKQFPRFFYSDSKHERSIGPVIFHLNYPRGVFQIRFSEKEPTKFVTKTLCWIDQPSDDEETKTINDLVEWEEKFLKKEKDDKGK